MKVKKYYALRETVRSGWVCFDCDTELQKMKDRIYEQLQKDHQGLADSEFMNLQFIKRSEMRKFGLNWHDEEIGLQFEAQQEAEYEASLMRDHG